MEGSHGSGYPPFRYVDENRNLVGFEVDLLKEIGRRTGATIEFRDMPFDRLLDAVAGKQVDMAIGAITVTKEREDWWPFQTPTTG